MILTVGKNHADLPMIIVFKRDKTASPPDPAERPESDRRFTGKLGRQNHPGRNPGKVTSPATTVPIRRSEQMNTFLHQMRERLCGLGCDALAAVEHALLASN
jgi:hypothetical protein